jgi:hypothetical protein
MLTNIDLQNIAGKMHINLVAVCSKDELHKMPPKIGGYIVNMQNQADGQGTHWVSMVLYSDGKSLKSLYFDSYGVRPPIEVEQYVKNVTDNKIAYNTRMIQKINTTECGWYALSFIFNMQYKRKYDNMLLDFNHYVNQYSNDLNKELVILKKSFHPYHVNFYGKSIKLMNWFKD